MDWFLVSRYSIPYFTQLVLSLLITAYLIMREHRGEMSLESEVGAGTRVWIRLPVGQGS